MTNAEWIMKKGWKFGSDNAVRMWLEAGTGACFVSWLDEEHKDEPVLDEEERKYLGAVIAPFRSKVNFVEKIQYQRKEFIEIGLGSESMSLPFFPEGKMYKGMCPGRAYTLEELGL